MIDELWSVRIGRVTVLDHDLAEGLARLFRVKAYSRWFRRKATS